MWRGAARSGAERTVGLEVSGAQIRKVQLGTLAARGTTDKVAINNLLMARVFRHRNRAEHSQVWLHNNRRVGPRMCQQSATACLLLSPSGTVHGRALSEVAVVYPITF